MKQQRFTSAMLNQNKNSFTEFLKGTGKYLFAIALIFLIVIAGLWQCRPAFASSTDWHDNELSEQIGDETRCELKGGVYENGVCLPPNLTPTMERELQAYTAQKQTEIDRTLGRQK